MSAFLIWNLLFGWSGDVRRNLSNATLRWRYLNGCNSGWEICPAAEKWQLINSNNPHWNAEIRTFATLVNGTRLSQTAQNQLGAWKKSSACDSVNWLSKKNREIYLLSIDKLIEPVWTSFHISIHLSANLVSKHQMYYQLLKWTARKTLWLCFFVFDNTLLRPCISAFFFLFPSLTQSVQSADTITTNIIIKLNVKGSDLTASVDDSFENARMRFQNQNTYFVTVALEPVRCLLMQRSAQAGTHPFASVRCATVVLVTYNTVTQSRSLFIRRMMKMTDELGRNGLYFDYLYNLRVLDPNVSSETSELKEKSGDYIDSKHNSIQSIKTV